MTKLLTLVKQTNSVLAANMDAVIEFLGVDLRWNGRYYVGPCPIHNGDNPNAFNLFPDGDSFPGYWVCHTRHCEKNGSGPVKLISALMGWSTREVCRWAQHQSFPAPKKVIKVSSKVINLDREQVRSTLVIPSRYYIEKGFSPQVLNDYDVGLCTNPHKEMYRRIVFPVYYINKCVGCIGRTIDPVTKYNPKWRPNKGFRIHKFLYNFDNLNSDTVIIVESCGNVLKLVQNGFKNVVGLFGSNIYRSQILDLKLKEVKRVLLCMDNDQAGREGEISIKEKLPFCVDFIRFEGYNDIAEMPDSQVKELFRDHSFIGQETIR